MKFLGRVYEEYNKQGTFGRKIGYKDWN